jgi:hypothetical protein
LVVRCPSAGCCDGFCCVIAGRNVRRVSLTHSPLLPQPA